MGRSTLLIVLILLLTGGCGGKKPKFTEEELAQMPLAQREGLPRPSGGFVLAVGDETVTSDEVITPLIEQLRPAAQRSSFEQFAIQVRDLVEQVIVTRVSNILLCRQAKKEASEDIDEALEKAAEAEVRRFVVHFEGDYAKAEEALKQRGMDWASFKEYQKKMLLTYSYMKEQTPEDRPITYTDLIECYNDMKDEFFTIPAKFKFRLIDIETAKLQVTDPNKTRQEYAKELTDDLIGRLQAGEDFGILAQMYSHGHRRGFGGLWKQVNPESLAEPYDILKAEAERLQPGQITAPIESGGHIFIMKLEEKTAGNAKPLEEVQKIVEEKITFDRKKAALDRFSRKLVQQAALSNRDEFIDFCLKEIYRMSNQ